MTGWKSERVNTWMDERVEEWKSRWLDGRVSEGYNNVEEEQ